MGIAEMDMEQKTCAREGWKTVKFGDIARNVSERVEPQDTDLEIYVGLEHLDPDSLRITRWGSPADVIGQKLRVRPGQIIFGKRRAYQRKVAVADFDGICSAHAMVLEAIPEAIIPEFLPFFMQSDMFMNRAVSISEGSLSPTIKWKTLANQEFPLPPLESQKRLINILGKVKGLISKRKELRQQLDGLCKSIFMKMFGNPVKNEKVWKIHTISNVCSEIVDCINKTAPQVEHPTPFKMIRTSNIRNCKINLENIKYVDEATYKIWTRRSVPQKGDILFTREAPMGEVAIVDFDDHIFLGQRIMQYRCNTNLISPNFLLALINSDSFQRHIDILGKGATVKHLAVPDCYNFNIIVPPVDLQNQFATIIEMIEGIKVQNQKTLMELEKLYGILSHKALKGDLDV